MEEIVSKNEVRRLRDRFLELYHETRYQAEQLEIEYYQLINQPGFINGMVRLRESASQRADAVWQAGSGLQQDLINNDDFTTLMEGLKARKQLPDLFPHKPFPDWFSPTPARFNYEIAWDFSRFMLVLPTHLERIHQTYLREQRDQWGLMTYENRDISKELMDVADALKAITGSTTQASSTRLDDGLKNRIREEFAAVEAIAADAADTSGPAGNGSPPEAVKDVNAPRNLERDKTLWEIHLDADLTWPEIVAKAKEKSEFQHLEPGTARKSVESLCRRKPSEYRWVERTHKNRKPKK